MQKILFALIWLLLTGPAFAQARNQELGVVNYFAKYEHADKKREAAYRKEVNDLFNALKKLEPKTEWIDVDIFLTDNKSKRDAFKRIYIPYQTDWFTLEMYQSMLDYVKSGGLLITESGLLFLDKDGQYVAGADFKPESLGGKTILGVKASGGNCFAEIKVVKNNTLTAGLEDNKWLKINNIMGRATKKLSAVTVITAKQKNKKGESEGPLLSYMTTADGACVYLACPYKPEENTLTKIVKNVLSEDTLKSLCKVPADAKK